MVRANEDYFQPRPAFVARACAWEKILEKVRTVLPAAPRWYLRRLNVTGKRPGKDIT